MRQGTRGVGGHARNPWLSLDASADGRTVLKRAYVCEHPPLSCQTPAVASPQDKTTVLHSAALGGRLDLVRQLLAKNVEIDPRDKVMRM